MSVWLHAFTLNKNNYLFAALSVSGKTSTLSVNLSDYYQAKGFLICLYEYHLNTSPTIQKIAKTNLSNTEHLNHISNCYTCNH
jgi:hypothetical protein